MTTELNGIIDYRGNQKFIKMRKLNKKYTKEPYFHDMGHDSLGYQKSLAWEILPEPKGKCVVPTIYGFDIIIDPTLISFVEKDLYFLGTYEAGIMDVIQKNLSRGDVFIDVGANVGVMTLLASRVVGEMGFVYSFEPHPDLYTNLKENIRVNSANNVMCMPVGIGDREESRYLFERDVCRGASTLVDRAGNSDNKYLVDVRTLDDLMSNHKRGVNMIKIDAEGYDLKVLFGADGTIRKYQPIIIIECSPHYPDSWEIMEWLKQRNYRLYKLKNRQHFIGDLIEVYNLDDIHDKGKITDLVCFPRR